MSSKRGTKRETPENQLLRLSEAAEYTGVLAMYLQPRLGVHAHPINFETVNGLSVRQLKSHGSMSALRKHAKDRYGVNVIEETDWVRWLNDPFAPSRYPGDVFVDLHDEDVITLEDAQRRTGFPFVDWRHTLGFDPMGLLSYKAGYYVTAAELDRAMGERGRDSLADYLIERSWKVIVNGRNEAFADYVNNTIEARRAAKLAAQVRRH